MQIAPDISAELSHLSDSDKALTLSRFFKTGKGEYGEGDRFLGVKVPEIRSIVKKYHKSASLADVDLLTRSTFHEERLAGFLLLVAIYEKAKKSKGPHTEEDILSYYLNIIERGNNWDLVDLVAPKILGDAMVGDKSREAIAVQLLSTDNLWKQRCGIVSTLPLIKNGDFELALDAISMLKNHPHDLIHKACGWMLREVGKKDKNIMLAFLDKHCTQLPRTTLRYALEHLEPKQKMDYMTRKDVAQRNLKITELPKEKPIPMSHRLSLPKRKPQ